MNNKNYLYLTSPLCYFIQYTVLCIYTGNLITAFAATYLPQALLKKQLTYGVGVRILTSTVLASGVSYYITTQQTKICQAAWLAVEEKHTYLAPMKSE
jgi:hypothetical protein